MRKIMFKVLLVMNILVFSSCSFYKKTYSNLAEALQSKKNVKSLELNLCSNINLDLYDSIYTLSSLKYLRISECSKISDFPKYIDQLNLTHLEFYWNGNGKKIPDYSILGNITSLKHLKLGAYGRIKRIPVSYKKLKELKYLDLQLTDLESIPLWIDELSNLEIIDISSCILGIDSLPVSQLNKLKKLKKIIAYDSKFTCDSIYMKSIEKRLKCKIEY